MSPMLVAADLRVSYGAAEVVRGIDLRVAKDECVALLGPNGAGKTSTLRAITGLVPYSGSIKYDGEEVSKSRTDRLARSGLLHVPEGRRVFAGLSVQENLTVARSARNGRSSSFGLDAVYELFPALASLRHREAWALSGGEQQMLALGRALMGAPRMLLLDEPSLGLAPSITDVVFDAISRISSAVPVLLVEQNTEYALAVASRVYVISAGEIRLSGDETAVGDRSKLIESYLDIEPPAHLKGEPTDAHGAPRLETEEEIYNGGH